MNKILLVYEDYSELMNVEAALKKIGFDVLGVTNEYSLAEQVLSFNPEVVVANGRGGKVSSLGVGKRLKEMGRWPGQVVLIFPAHGKPSTQDLMKIRTDLMLESPVPPLRLIQVLAKLLGHDETQLLERMNKIIHADTGGGPQFNLNPQKGSTEGGQERFYVGGGQAANEKDIVRVHGENEEGLGHENVEGTEEGGSFLSRLKSAKDLYEEGKIEAGSSENELFPDVDLKSLEAEITGKPAQEQSSPEKGAAEEALDEAAQAAIQNEIREAQDHVSERVAKYAKMTESVELSPRSTVRRVEARRRQRELVKDWDKENLKDIDELRREFTKALFKK